MRSALEKLLALAAAGVVACTAIVSTDPVQCSTDADCTKRGPDFVGTICTNELCVPGARDAGSTGTNACKATSDCVAQGPGLVCASHTKTCAPLESEDCKVVYGNPSADGAVLFGLLSEVGISDTNYFRQQQYATAAKLAFTEFFERTGGGAGVSFPNGGAKGALIACSEHFPRKSAAHLANLGVKAVIGPSAEDRQRAVVETLLPARIPSFTPWINGNPAEVLPNSSGFAWLAAFQRRDVVDPLNALVAEREALIRAKPGRPNSNIRIAVVVNESAPSASGTPAFNAFREYGDLMDQRLLFNRKTAVENQNDLSCAGPCYKRFSTNQAVVATVAQRATDIAAFKPDIIIPFTDIDWGAQLLPALEAKFAPLPVADRPTYLQPFLQIEDAGYRSLDVKDATLRARVTGIRPLRDNSFELFVNAFREAYKSPTDATKLGPTPNPGAGRAFETSLLLLLTTYAAFVEKPDPTPEDILAALPKTTDRNGERVTLFDLSRGVNSLNSRAPINLDGLFTFFDLDIPSHSAPATWTTWCMDDAGQYYSKGRVFRPSGFEGPGGPLCE